MACTRSMALSLLAWGFTANAASAAAAAGDCTGLQGKAPPDAQITATLHPAGPFVIPPELGPSRSVQLPAFCRVQGVLKPTPDSAIAFEVWLPVEVFA